MLVYRVFPYLPSAAPAASGHPLYEHKPQSGGRVDHPDYFTWYVARQAEAAVGETFGNLETWSDAMFETPFLPGGRRALGVYSLPDDLRFVDLDDPAELQRQSLRPTQVVVRNLAVTQAWGHRIWDTRQAHDRTQRQWQAVQWWSHHRPSWTVIASWEPPTLVRVEDLTLDHPAVIEAASALYRPLPAP